MYIIDTYLDKDRLPVLEKKELSVSKTGRKNTYIFWHLTKSVI